MPAMAIRRCRGRLNANARARAWGEVLSRSRWAERCKPQARELVTLRVLMTTERLQKLVRGIFFRCTFGLVPKEAWNSCWMGTQQL
jgi:hypothetical protein